MLSKSDSVISLDDTDPSFPILNTGLPGYNLTILPDPRFILSPSSENLVAMPVLMLEVVLLFPELRTDRNLPSGDITLITTLSLNVRSFILPF